MADLLQHTLCGIEVVLPGNRQRNGSSSCTNLEWDLT